MNEHELRNLLTGVRNKSLPIDSAIERLRHMPSELLSSAQLDHHRTLRTGLPEAVFGENKSAGQLIEQAGLKAARTGEAMVCADNPNFIVANTGATSADVLKLIELLQNGVNETLGVELETEIEIW